MRKAQQKGNTAAEKLGLPVSVAEGELRLHLQGSRRLVAQGHRGVLEYTQSLLRLLGKGLVVVVEGEELVLDALTGQDACITGRIQSIVLKDAQ